MPNTNPIQQKRPVNPTPYIIPAVDIDKAISLSITITLLDDDWEYTPNIHVFLNGNDLYPDGTPEPQDLALDTGDKLIDNKVAITASISRIYTDGELTGPNTKVKFGLILNASGEAIGDLFEFTGGTENPSKFYATMLFSKGI